MRASKDRSVKNKAKEIAIIGAGMIFPAGIDSPQSLWDFMEKGMNACTEVPADRWTVKRFYSPDQAAPGKTTMKRGHFIARPSEAFDPALFDLSPREASLLDPLQRNALEAAWRAMEDSRLKPSHLYGSKTGVYMGAFLDDFLIYSGRPEMRTRIMDHYSAVGGTAGMVSARLGHVFNLKGPAMSIDTACSSSMTAIVQACEALISGECEMAFAGGSSFMLIFEPAMTMSKAGFLAQDGRSKSFSAEADGYGRGEGAGVLLLKPLETALQDGDFIRAVISAGALNQDGRTAAVPVPSRKAQEALITKILDKAAVHPDEISAVEAHGAGTPVGDPIEAAAIVQAIAGKRSENRPPLPIGSVKANIGHLEASAGVAGTMRAMLCLEHQTLPRWPLTGSVADCIKESPLFVPKQALGLSARDKDGHLKPLRILANSFGYGGANAAVLLRSLTQKETQIFSRKNNPEKIPASLAEMSSFLPLSAATFLALRELAGRYADFLAHLLEENKAQEISQQKSESEIWEMLCLNVRVQRDFLPCRAVFTKGDSSLEEMMALLRDFSKGLEPQEVKSFFLSEAQGATLFPHPVGIFFSAQPDSALSKGGRFLLDLPANLTPRTAALKREMKTLSPKHKSAAFLTKSVSRFPSEEGENCSPVLSALLQLAAAEWLEGTGLSLKALCREESSPKNMAGLLSLYFNQAITPLEVAEKLLALEESQDPAFLSVTGWQKKPSVSEISSEFFIMLGAERASRQFLRPSKEGHLQDSLTEIAGDLFAKGACFTEPKQKGGRLLTLPPYPLGLELFHWPDRMEARRDRLDLTLHPILGTPDNGIAGRGWRADLTTGFLSWLPDHALERGAFEAGPMRGQGSDWLFPFAGLVEAALAAHFHLTAKIPCLLESLRMDLPLFPARDQTTILDWQFHLNSRRLEMSAFTPSGVGPEVDWAVYGSAKIAESAPWPQKSENIALEIKKKKDRLTEIPPSFLYREMRSCGLAYGPSFRCVRSLYRTGTGEGAVAYGHIALPEEIRAGEDRRYLIHPAVLDGAFQLAAILIPPQDQLFYAPCELERFIWYGGEAKQNEAGENQPDNIQSLYAKVILVKKRAKEIVLDLSLCDAQGQLLGQVRGLHCRSQNREMPVQLLRPTWESLPAIPLLATPRKLLLLGKPNEIAQLSLERLRKNGAEIQVLHDVSEIEDFLTANDSPSRLLYFPSLQEGDSLAALTDLLEEMRRISVLASEQKSFTCVIAGEGHFAGIFASSENGSKPNVANLPQKLLLSSLAGFVRSLRIEYPAQHLRIVFFQSQSPSDPVLSALLAAELVCETESETEIFLTSSGRLGMRTAEIKEEDRKATEILETSHENQAGFVLKQNCFGRKGVSALGWEQQILPPPSPHQVRVKTLAVGLNFKDLLNASGVLAESVLRNTHTAGQLGMEAIVKIEEVGALVKDFVPGQFCLSFAPGSFASQRLLETQNNLLYPLSDTEEALASLPSISALAGFSAAALTAWRSLISLARLEKGETVLIHSAAGGVGQMALQIARWRGARIFATAGSEKRRRWLSAQEGVEGVWDSRTLAFADGIKEKTGGVGVDVALNCLWGEALTATLEIMAPFGRFVEIGKRDIAEGKSLNLAPFNESISFFAYDLDRLMKLRPETVRADYQALYGLLQKGEISPPEYRSFSPDEVQEAFRHFSSPEHCGRVILDFEKPVEAEKIAEKASLLLENPKNKFFLDPHAAYLVTGGTGGFGQATLQWLIEGGARSLYAMGRTNPKNLEKKSASAWKKLLKKAKEAGAELIFCKADVSDPKQVKKSLSKITEGRKLAAIFHAAGTTRDMPANEMKKTDISEVLAPKIAGASALWEACQKLEKLPEYFVFYSSLAGFTGNQGQAAYTAANVFLDNFSDWLGAKGIKALSVAWGQIAGRGMSESSQTAASLFRQAGILPISPFEALDQMTILAAESVSWGICAKVDWRRFFRLFPQATQEERFSLLRVIENINAENILASLPKVEQKTYAIKVIIEEVSAILHLETGAVTARTQLDSLGLDSLAAMELQTILQKRLGVILPPALLATSPTPASLSTHIIRIALAEAEKNKQAEARQEIEAALPETEEVKS